MMSLVTFKSVRTESDPLNLPSVQVWRIVLVDMDLQLFLKVTWSYNDGIISIFQSGLILIGFLFLRSHPSWETIALCEGDF